MRPACGHRLGSSNLVWVIFGPSNDLFETWKASFITMTRAALGEFDNIYPQMVEVNPEASFLLIFTYQVRGVPPSDGPRRGLDLTSPVYLLPWVVHPSSMPPCVSAGWGGGG